MKLSLAAFTILISFHISFSQTKIQFGEIDEKFFSMTHCPFDSSAGAFVIEDYGFSSLNAAYNLDFQYHGVIKILSKDELDRASIKIRHSNDSRITKFKASTYNYEDGKVVESSIKKSDAIIEKINDNTNSFNFNLPNVREGSIIEYTYSVTSGSLTSLKTWYFQSSIPAIKSQYEVMVPNYFQYERMLQGYHPLAKGEVTQKYSAINGQRVPFQHHNYIALNVPAFKTEPYITTTSDYISKIDFELKKYQFPNETEKVYLPKDYAALAKKMYESEYWHGNITKSKFTKDAVEVLKVTSNSKAALAESIFYYVRDNFTENYDNKYPSLKKVFSEKKGTGGDINMVLAAMLNEAGFDVNLVRISTRSHGKINPHVPIARQFNFTIVKVIVDESERLLDASDKNTPYEALPKYCLNGKGLVIAPTEQWVALKPFASNGTTYSGNFEVTEEGILNGNVTIRRMGYRAWRFKDDVEDDGIEDYKNSFYSNNETWNINNHELGELKEGYQLDEKIEAEIEDKVDDLGDVMYLNPIIVGQITDNPFKTEKRKYPVDYGAPFTNTYIMKFRLAKGLEVDELPQPKSIKLPNNSGKLLYSASFMNGEITITNRIQISKSEFSSSEYAFLREFYALIVEKHGEQIVLRRP
ncbi:MAG: DUF3857 domain-containing protein [Ekhidna sp.]